MIPGHEHRVGSIRHHLTTPLVTVDLGGGSAVYWLDPGRPAFERSRSLDVFDLRKKVIEEYGERTVSREGGS
jgi:hypothetical protein